MCGRYSSSRSPADLMDEFEVEALHGDDVEASWNVAPTQSVWTVLERAPRNSDGGPVRQLRTARWGLVPSWAKDRSVGSRMINARIETVTEKPAFKAAARKRRCLLPADGYYEWERRDGGKTKIPWFLRAADGAGLAFAGLYELWPDPELPEDAPDRWLWSITIITTAATDTLGHIHDRSPLIVPPSLHRDWLDPTTTGLDDVRELLAEIPEPHLQPHAVSSAVNSPSNNGPELVVPVEV